MQDEPNNGQQLPAAAPAPVAAERYQTYPAQRAKLSMIATPLGNLGDLSERVVHALLNVDELWCEDTRHTLALLQAIQRDWPAKYASLMGDVPERFPRLKRVDQHTADADIRRGLESAAASGQWIGMVSDAGTPGVSDPGGKVTQLATHFPLIRIEPIPGPSAVSALVSIAGFEENSFVFKGFLPRSESETVDLLDRLKSSGVSRNWIFFESPNRIRDSIRVFRRWNAAQPFQADFLFAKELTKLHESVYRGRGDAFFEGLDSNDLDDRGEWCAAVILPKSYVIEEKSESDWEVALECLIVAEISPKVATSIVVQRFSVAKNLAYRRATELQRELGKKN
jgi:16S rRNA (cytidine1402-2'-O)-methyltransferase